MLIKNVSELLVMSHSCTPITNESTIVSNQLCSQSTVKMNGKSDDILSDSLKLLWLCRYHPALNPWWTTLLIPLNVLLCGLFAALALKGILMSYNDDLFFTAECLQTIILMVHTAVKQIILHVYKHSMNELLEEKSKFWRTDSLETTISFECSLILRTGKRVIRYYFYLVSVGAVFFVTQPFTTHQIPVVCYIPDGWFAYLTVIFWYLIYFLVLSAVSTDGFFCSLATSLIVQFKLLGHEFKLLEIGSEHQKKKLMWTKIKRLVDYHNFLISYCSKINKMFSGLFLVQFLISITSAAVALFILGQPGPLVNQIKCLIYLSVLIIEMGFYCLPVELVVNSASKISDLVFESRWYESSVVELRKSLTIVLVRAQRAIVFSGYGLVWINLRTFLVVYKTAFTLYTFLNFVTRTQS